MHGKKPIDGLGPKLLTFIWPFHADTETEMDPLEMLLNPEASEVEATYIYFMPFDYVSW